VSLLLPQAVGAIASIALLYYLLAQIFGSRVALLAALALAVTPIAVIDGRNNSPDSLLTFALLLAAWAVTKATETGRTRWLFLSAVFIGLGFNIKELEAFLVVPAIAAAYWVGDPQGLVVSPLAIDPVGHGHLGRVAGMDRGCGSHPAGASART